jgi:hypothetical protein
MGLIRKTLNAGTGGAVRPESTKQRYSRMAAGVPDPEPEAARDAREARAEAREARRTKPESTGWLHRAMRRIAGW